jgi:archaellum biogenesis ATPase FlaH
MGLSINIPGLGDFIKEIPDKNLILIEGEMDNIKTFFVQKIGYNATKIGKNITYITSNDREELQHQLCQYKFKLDKVTILNGNSLSHIRKYITKNSVLIIDSFSYLTLEQELSQFKDILEDIRKMCKKENAIIFLTIETGMLPHRMEKILAHVTDGIIQFKTKESSKGIVRFIRIPKWANGNIIDSNIYYTFNKREINIDLRSRVV